MTNQQHEPPEFIAVEMGEEKGFVPFEEAVTNPELTVRIIGQALSEVRDWNSRYAAFIERIQDHSAGELVEAISRVLETARQSASAEDGLMVDSDG